MEHLRISLAFFFWSTEASWNLLIKKKYLNFLEHTDILKRHRKLQNEKKKK